VPEGDSECPALTFLRVKGSNNEESEDVPKLFRLARGDSGSSGRCYPKPDRIKSVKYDSTDGGGCIRKKDKRKPFIPKLECKEGGYERQKSSQSCKDTAELTRGVEFNDEKAMVNAESERQGRVAGRLRPRENSPGMREKKSQWDVGERSRSSY